MHPECEKRAAHLAVSRYGAAAAKVQRLYQQTKQAQTKGLVVDFLDMLVRQRLLTDKQAQELRAGLDATHIDTDALTPPGRRGGAEPRAMATNGKVGGKPVAAKPTAELAVFDLRQLGNYHILRRLGEGGMGSVFLGYKEGDHQHVAIKVLPDNLAANQAAIDRFYREAKSGALLNHNNIVRNLAIGQDRATSKHYLVMEYVDGASAQELLQRKGRLEVGDAVHIALDIARALEHCHSRNIVHRDIKPDNILLTQSGVAKLTDMGLAKRTDEASHLTAARQGFGTPYYMPYEQAVNARHADGRSDIYALGATLYHLVAGEVPFPGNDHLEVVDKKSTGDFPPASFHRADVPPMLDAILAKMLAREPANRYQTASELIVELERSGLAAKMPSFADADRALQDPVVQERLASPSQATALDIHAADVETRADDPNDEPDIWYVRYRDHAGKWCKAKATTEQVLKRVREGRFTDEGEDEVQACHQHNGEFKSLASYAEFGKALAAGTKLRKKNKANSAAALSAVADKDEEAEKPRHGNGSRVTLWLFACLGMTLALVGAVLASVWLF